MGQISKAQPLYETPFFFPLENPPKLAPGPLFIYFLINFIESFNFCVRFYDTSICF